MYAANIVYNKTMSVSFNIILRISPYRSNCNETFVMHACLSASVLMKQQPDVSCAFIVFVLFAKIEYIIGLLKQTVYNITVH